MFKGTVVLVPFPFTDLSGNKVRPCLVLHGSKKGEDCIVLCISSQKQKRLGEFDVLVKPSKGNGLKVDSVIKVEKIATLQKKIILGELGFLESKNTKQVDGILNTLFGLK